MKRTIFALAASIMLCRAAMAQAPAAAPPPAAPTVTLTLQEVDGLAAVLGEAPAKLSAQALLFLLSKRQQATQAAPPAP